MIGLCANQVKDVGIPLESLEVDALDKQVRLCAFLCDDHDLLDIFLVANQDTLDSLVGQRQHKKFLEFKRELESDCSRLAFIKLKIALDVRQVLAVFLTEHLHELANVSLLGVNTFGLIDSEFSFIRHRNA